VLAKARTLLGPGVLFLLLAVPPGFVALLTADRRSVSS